MPLILFLVIGFARASELLSGPRPVNARCDRALTSVAAVRTVSDFTLDRESLRVPGMPLAFAMGPGHVIVNVTRHGVNWVAVVDNTSVGLGLRANITPVGLTLPTDLILNARVDVARTRLILHLGRFGKSIFSRRRNFLMGIEFRDGLATVGPSVEIKRGDVLTDRAVPPEFRAGAQPPRSTSRAATEIMGLVRAHIRASDPRADVQLTSLGEQTVGDVWYGYFARVTGDRTRVHIARVGPDLTFTEFNVAGEIDPRLFVPHATSPTTVYTSLRSFDRNRGGDEWKLVRLRLDRPTWTY